MATTFDTAAKLGFTTDYKFKDVFSANLDDLGALYIPTVAPIFYVKLAPDLFSRGDCHVNLSMATPELRGKFWIKVEMIEFEPYVYFKKLRPRDEQEQKEEDESNRWSGAVEFNGFIQLGVKEEFSFGTNKIVSWFVDGEIDATTFIGPKLSGALNLSFSNAIQDQLSVYNVAKDTKLSFNPLAVDYQSEAEVKTLWGSHKKVTLAEGSLDLFPGINGIDIYAFPEFSLDTETGKDEAGNTTVTATVKPSRNLIWPVDYGAGIFNEENEMVDYCWGTEIGVQMYGMFELHYPKDEQYLHTFTVNAPGKYTVRPIFKIGGCDIVAAPAKEFEVVGPPQITPSAEQMTFPAEGGEQTVNIITNVNDITLSKSASWLSATYDAETQILTVKADKNSSDEGREDTITLEASNAAGLAVSTITIKQTGAEDDNKDSRWDDFNFDLMTLTVYVNHENGQTGIEASAGDGGGWSYDERTFDGNTLHCVLRRETSSETSNSTAIITMNGVIDDKTNTMNLSVHHTRENKANMNGGYTTSITIGETTFAVDSVKLMSFQEQNSNSELKPNRYTWFHLEREKNRSYKKELDPLRFVKDFSSMTSYKTYAKDPNTGENTILVNEHTDIKTLDDAKGFETTLFFYEFLKGYEDE